MLHVHRAERADGLVEALRELLADPVGDPFAPEVVAVPTRGMERWLTQRLSTRLGARPGGEDGICAHVEFPSPRRLVGEAVAAATGTDPDADPWLPERAVWPLLEVVDEALGEPWLHPLSVHLGGPAPGADPARRARRFATVRHLADLYDRYALLRPDMVRGWSAGGALGGGGAPLRDDVAWQAELWRRLRARIGQPGPAERLEGACDRLRAEPEVCALPARIALFGLTRLPAGHLAVLRALAHARDVHLGLLHPSPRLWEEVAVRTAGAAPVVRRALDPTAALPANRLLASWGQDARELQLVLGAPAPDVGDHHRDSRRAEGTLLARLQAGVRADEAPPGAPLPGEPDRRPALAAGDDSVQVHACHGRARQVEVVRDVVLHLLAEDPALEPRDVIVMCPDIEAFAPLVQATFGAGEVASEDLDAEPRPAAAGDAPDLRVRLADRALRQTNPVLGVVGRLLDLAEGRVTASELLDLADREPVRRRFALDDDDLARMEEWVAAGGVRWGLDAAHRAPYKLEGLEANTWRAGLDRLLVGVAMTEDDQRLFGGVLPLDDVESGSIDLAGRLAELVDRAQAALDALADPKPVDEWARALAEAADALTATGPRDAWQRAELGRILEDVVAEATTGAAVHPAVLGLEEVRALLADRLAGRPTRANFRTGHLTVCTLVPMRSVPHRVVCLLGLDDAVFPRRAPRDGDDLVLDDPHVGDRDPRAEDRQMLLDALMAATDRLVIAYTGNDERTNAPRPPAVPVGELLDMVDRTVRADGGEAREQVVVRHPLQPFDPRNFTPGALRPGRPWSFDGVTLEGARALAGERAGPRPFLTGPLPGAVEPVVELDRLVAFAERPVRAFLRLRLGIGAGRADEEVDDGLPVELGGLESWAVGQRLLDAVLAGTGLDAAVAAERARGTLPPGRLADPVIGRVRPLVEAIAARALRSWPAGAPGSVDVRVALAGGRVLSGTVAGVRGDGVGVVTFSRVSARHRLAAWVRLLALTAARPERPWAATTVGRARVGVQAQVTAARLAPLGADAAARSQAALAHLATLVDLYDRGMREPLPIACLASAAYAQAARSGASAEAAGRREWESGWNREREDAEPEHELVLGGRRSFAELLAVAPRADEAGPGWEEGDPSRFGRHARRLWAGVLDHETLEDG